LTSKPSSEQLFLVKKTADGYLAHRLSEPGTFVAVPPPGGSWKPFTPEKQNPKED
jgi:hypothetical protein